MLITRSLIESSQRRMRRSKIDPEKLSKELGDGPLRLTPEKKQQRYRQCLALTGTPERARAALERIINGNDLDNINYLSKGVGAARPVCRIQLRDSSGAVIGFGSGLLIGPGVLMTNHHVFGQASEARHSVADFDHELDDRGRERQVAHFAFDPGRLFYANAALDFAVVAVQPRSEEGRALSDWGWLGLNSEPGKSDPGEYLTIIQHPNGERKQVCVRENKFVKYERDAMWYTTDTLGGSSGSPVFNRFWQVVALHHSGVPRTDKQGRWLTLDGQVWDESMDESRIDWIANEGIRISAIVNHLSARVGSHPMVKAALEATPPVLEASVDPLSGGRPRPDGAWVEQSGGTVSLVVPVRVPMDLVRRDVPGAAAGAPVTAPQTPAVLAPASLPIEAVKINHKTLGTRPGYKPDFLGTGKLRVPLPTIPAALKPRVATLTAKPSAFELKYFNYSVVMNKARKLAFFSAVNIDGRLRQDVGKREGDSWLRDPRIKPELQVGDEFYGKQKTFEASRAKNPFDRGHLVRRLDGTWGKDVAQAKEHGDDTFHFTNAAPQFFSFNQGKKLWLGLEEFVLDQLEADARKGCVFNGPVFDGPLAPRGELPDVHAPSRADPTFGGVGIPKFFWKLMVIRRGNALVASAFLLSQQDQILDIDRIHESAIFEKLTETEAKVFQISIGDLARLTRLRFGTLAQVDSKEAAALGPRLIDSFDDIRF